MFSAVMGCDFDSSGVRMSQGDTISFYLVLDGVAKWSQTLDQNNLPLYKPHFHITTADLAGATYARYGAFLAWRQRTQRNGV
jgi:hypothetical protein